MQEEMFKFRVVFGFYLLFQSVFTSCLAQAANESQQNELSISENGTLETGVLQNIVGFEGNLLGAEIISVVADENSNLEKIEISVPVDPELVDKVIVKSASGVKVKLEEPADIYRDHENNKVGIILALPKKAKIGFKIMLIDLPDE